MADLVAGLQRLLDVSEPGRAARVVRCEPLLGGYSRVSARAVVEWPDGSGELILRGDPPAGTGVFVSDRDAEWALLRALPEACPVATPTARWYDATGEHLGSKCIVMDAAEGARSLHDLMAAGDDPESGTELFVDTFAALHRTPVDGLGLPVPDDWSSYIGSVLDRYRRLGDRYPAQRPLLHFVADWADDHRPPPVPLTLVHGDCQPGNVLVRPDGTPLVIDWEFTHVGDPREDLGFYTQIPMAPNLYWRGPEAFLARYRERSGLSAEQVDPRIVEYFLIIGIARLYEQLLDAAAAIGGDTRPGVMAAYLINAVSHLNSLFLDICGRS
ncbi:phosphotransferase family protein [Jatrophihabitans fulvus]